MPKSLEISSEYIGLEQLNVYFKEDIRLELSQDSRKNIERNRRFLEESIKDDSKRIYGVNTGFGSLCDVAISPEQIETLQHNLIMSHACGQGEAIPKDLSKLILLLKIKNLAFAKSGVRTILLDKLLHLYNNDLIPVIYEQGSLGASGDLVPLAHMSLPLIGEGKVWRNDEIVLCKDLIEEGLIEPISLSFKEGLALINGTQFSLAYSFWTSYHSGRLLRWSSLIAAGALEAFQCSMDPFDAELHKLRNQNGQIYIAQEIKEICKDSEILSRNYNGVQDPYSFRCIPQVHGASKDALDYFCTIVERELNAVTDNPNILDDSGKILSGGNFHAQPLALALDFASIALSELGSISERRIYKLVDGQRGLPDYLTRFPGLNSGFMIPQYTAASIVSQNKQLCSPASVDTISSSKGQEDHVSMAANAATRIYRVVNNLYKVLSIELMCVCQALDLREDKGNSSIISRMKDDYRKEVSMLDNDRLLHDDMEKSRMFMLSNSY